MAERLRGRRAVAQRLRRLQAEPLCRYCAAKGAVREAIVPDHIVPLTKGGSDDDSNIRCLCSSSCGGQLQPRRTDDGPLDRPSYRERRRVRC